MSVKTIDCAAFEAAMKGNACYALGRVEAGDQITFSNGDDAVLSASMAVLRVAWKGTLDGGAN